MELVATQPISLKAPCMRVKGKSGVPALYQTSTESVPNTHSSLWSTAIPITPSGEPSALAKSKGSTDVPSSNWLTHIF